MKKQKAPYLLPFILLAALLAGCATTVVDKSVQPGRSTDTLAKLTNSEDIFTEVVAKYLAANPKPQLPEEVRKYRVQAEFAVKEKQFGKAAELYGKALEFAPWWPQGYFNRALILGELKRFGEATREIKRYVRLVPDAPETRTIQDRIYEWEVAAKLSKPGYEGDIVNGKAHGKGSFTWDNGDRYEGDFVDRARTGKGFLTWANGDRYEGDFVDGKRTGRGILTWPNGDRYEGDFVDDKRTGKGFLTWPNGDRYEGDFVDGKRTGRGIYTWANGDRYEGDFVDDNMTGRK